MRLVLCRISDSTGPARDASWRLLRAPTGALGTLLELQLGYMLGSVVLVLWAVLTPSINAMPDAGSLIAAVAVLLPLHELTHAAAFPRSLRSAQLSIALWSLSVQYDGILSRNRYLAVLAAPLLVITLLPLAVVAAAGYAFAPATLLSLLNVLSSGGDIVAIVLVLAQIPPGAIVRTQGEDTMWKLVPASMRNTSDERQIPAPRRISP